MNSKIKSGITFLSGLAIGAAGMFAFMKAKWMKEFDAKREEMIQYFKEKKPIEAKEEKDICEEPEVEEMKQVIAQNNYSKIYDSSERTKNMSPGLNDDYSDDPYEIDPREFGNQEMYGMVTFRLLDDGEILTEKYEPMTDEAIENYIGTKNLEKLANLRDANPELDSYYVRNDRLKLDCEILIGAESMEE